MRFLFLTLFLTGCFSTSKPTQSIETVEPLNREKDNYITKVEAVVSDSASALTAVVPTLDKGNARGLVEAQVTRLSGISKPSVQKVEEYARMIKQNDTKAVDKDKVEASKVESEIDALNALVEERDLELIEVHARADAEFKQKILWEYSTYGIGLFAIGVLTVAFTPFKKSGGIVVAGGMLAMASAWIFDSSWFLWIVGSVIAVTAFSIVYAIVKNNKAKPEDDPKQVG